VPSKKTNLTTFEGSHHHEKNVGESERLGPMGFGN
jgi:hypothetical protein